MAAKTGVNNKLFAMIWFGEFEEKDALVSRRSVSWKELLPVKVGSCGLNHESLPMRGHICSRLAGLLLKR